MPDILHQLFDKIFNQYSHMATIPHQTPVMHNGRKAIFMHEAAPIHGQRIARIRYEDDEDTAYVPFDQVYVRGE